jgi:hypothetical protein
VSFTLAAFFNSGFKTDKRSILIFGGGLFKFGRDKYNSKTGKIKNRAIAFSARVNNYGFIGPD